jgi:UDP-N-acetylglucosamine 1-carboxyvinyltransferase
VKTGLIGASHTVQPDHIEVASIAAISAVTPGRISIEPVIPVDMRMINKVYEQLGVQLILEDSSLHVYEHSNLKIASLNEEVDLTISTAPWPGFPSDLIAIATVLATQTNGTTLIHEKLFSNRLLFVDKLKAMGAQIVLCDPHRAITIGASPLRGEYIDTPDVRIGLGLLVAALCAEGESVIDRAELIGRNFENVVGKLIGLGAAIEVQ